MMRDPAISYISCFLYVPRLAEAGDIVDGGAKQHHMGRGAEKAGNDGHVFSVKPLTWYMNRREVHEKGGALQALRELCRPESPGKDARA
jgi:hypothetical protein